MALLVKKFGGSSLANLDKIKLVATQIKQAHDDGHQIVVVVSAMQGETDRLIAMAHQLNQLPDPRELDVLLATGEQITIALLSMALLELKCAARSYTGSQLRIITDSMHNKARILGIEQEKIIVDLHAGKIVVVAGFQGTDEYGNITTLGRGGSDTTAVALAAVLQADECQIYTDVDGVYTADPRIVGDAMRMDNITFEEMLELAGVGTKVLQIRSVELAGRYNVPVRVLSTFTPGPGTLITYNNKLLEQYEVTGVAYSRNEARIILRGVAGNSNYFSNILSALAGVNIEIDMIAQHSAMEGLIDYSFTVHHTDLQQTLNILNPLVAALDIHEFFVDSKVAKLSLVGVGLRSHTAVISKMFKIFCDLDMHIQLVSISEIKVSVVLDEKYIDEGVKALHKAFGLVKTETIFCQENAEFS